MLRVWTEPRARAVRPYETDAPAPLNMAVTRYIVYAAREAEGHAMQPVQHWYPSL